MALGIQRIHAPLCHVDPKSRTTGGAHHLPDIGLRLLSNQVIDFCRLDISCRILANSKRFEMRITTNDFGSFVVT
jgi:hypothetical protein